MAERYVFSIHSKTKWGIDLGVSFFTTYCPNDGAALALFEAVNGLLPNYAQLSVSKVLRECGNFDIPNSGATITDVSVVSYLLGNNDNPSVRKTVKIPLPYIKDGDLAKTPGYEQVMAALTANCCDSTGTALNICVGTSAAGKNIVQGGPM